MATHSASLNDAELQDLYAFSLSLARRAGKILLDGIERRTRGVGREDGASEEKDSSVDIVTQTDLDVEAFVKAEILGRYSNHAFIGEETYSAGASRDYLVGDGPTWVVDPLDGTVNYTHLFPMFCVSIAFLSGGIPVVGVIYQPVLDTTYSALHNHGAFQDLSHPTKPARRLPYINSPALPLPPQAPKGCIFSCEWGKDRKDTPGGNMSRKIESFVNMAAEIGGRGGKGGMVHGVRSLGSATLDLAYIAAGSFDIWWEGGCWEWDVAAGICILREAGGLITTANPPADWQTASVDDCKLGGRLYLAIRPAGDADGETGRQGQERVVREVWKRVVSLDYKRPGA